MKYFAILFVMMIGALSACNNKRWSKTERDQFLGVCFEEGGSKDYCHCYLEKLMNHSPIAEEVEQISFEERVEIAKDCD